MLDPCLSAPELTYLTLTPSLACSRKNIQTNDIFVDAWSYSNFWPIIIFYYSQKLSPLFLFVTVHDKTNHIAAKTIFELRRPLPNTTFELLLPL